jgi:hypothetical protein
MSRWRRFKKAVRDEVAFWTGGFPSCHRCDERDVFKPGELCPDCDCIYIDGGSVRDPRAGQLKSRREE